MSRILTSCLALEYLHHVFMLFPDAKFPLVSSLCLLQLLYPPPSAKLRAFHVAGVRFMYIEQTNQYLQNTLTNPIRGIIVLDMWPNYSKFSIVFLLIS